MTPQLITYAILGVTGVTLSTFLLTTFPGLVAWLPKVFKRSPKQLDNRADLAAALALLSDHVSNLTDKSQHKQGTDAIVDLSPLVFVRPA